MKNTLLFISIILAVAVTASCKKDNTFKLILPATAKADTPYLRSVSRADTPYLHNTVKLDTPYLAAAYADTPYLHR
jgi:hypothetical protein